MKNYFIIAAVCMLFFGCKTAKNVSDNSSIKTESRVQEDFKIDSKIEISTAESTDTTKEIEKEIKSEIKSETETIGKKTTFDKDGNVISIEEYTSVNKQLSWYMSQLASSVQEIKTKEEYIVALESKIAQLSAENREDIQLDIKTEEQSRTRWQIFQLIWFWVTWALILSYLVYKGVGWYKKRFV